MKLHAITWKYGDKSGFGIVGLYLSENRAKEIHGILVDHGDLEKVFEIQPVEAEVDISAEGDSLARPLEGYVPMESLGLTLGRQAKEALK